MAAGRADPERLVELAVEDHLLARRALRPQVGRVRLAAAAEARQLDRHQSSASGRGPDAGVSRPRPTVRTARAIGVGRARRQAT